MATLNTLHRQKTKSDGPAPPPVYCAKEALKAHKALGQLAPAYQGKSTSHSLAFRPFPKSDLDAKTIAPSYGDEVKKDDSGEENSLSDEHFVDVDMSVDLNLSAEPPGLLQGDLQIPFTIIAQHKVGFRLAASSSNKFLIADYVHVTLGPEVFAYLHAIKYNSHIVSPKPVVLDQAFGGIAAKTISCGVLGYALCSGYKSVGLNTAEMVTWDDVVTAVYMRPTKAYPASDPLWEAHDEWHYTTTYIHI